jgi:pimeloyl-ACP methyl ester carboxylesterase
MQIAVASALTSDGVVQISAGHADLRGHLMLGSSARGLVIVANGDGDHVYDETNAYVARRLQEAGFAALLIDLLTPNECAEDAETSALRFRHRLLASRLAKVTQWVRTDADFSGLAIGLFASGLCGRAALVASLASSSLKAIVCRGARLDVVVPRLVCVRAEVLLLVGERDTAHLDENRRACRLLPEGARLEVVPNAGHLLDDTEPLQRVVNATEFWFGRTLGPTSIPHSIPVGRQ